MHKVVGQVLRPWSFESVLKVTAATTLVLTLYAFSNSAESVLIPRDADEDISDL
jgi:hypothetical protein